MTVVNNFIQYTIVPMVQNKLLFDVSQYTLLISFLYVWFEPIVFGENSQVIPCISFITSDNMTMSHKGSNPLENLCQLGCQTSLFPSIEGVSFVSPDIANRFSLWFDFQSVVCLWLGMTLVDLLLIVSLLTLQYREKEWLVELLSRKWCWNCLFWTLLLN